MFAGAIVVLGMIACFVGVVIISETIARRGLVIPPFATALIADAVGAWVCPTRLSIRLARPFFDTVGEGGA